MKIDIEYEGITFNCEYEYEPAQAETALEPGSSAQAYVSKICIAGNNLFDLLQWSAIDAIEEKIVEAHQ